MGRVGPRSQDTNVAKVTVDALARDGIAYVPFFPLGGFTPLQSGTLNSVAARIGAKPMTVALTWLLRRSPNILLIPGTSSVAHLRENLAAADLILSEDDLAGLNAIASAELIQGPSVGGRGGQKAVAAGPEATCVEFC